MTTEFIAYHAALRPQAIAFICDGREISYTEFSRDAGKFIHAVKRFELPQGSFVAVACSDLYTHWLVLLALEHLGMATASFDTEEGHHATPMLARMDLVISDQVLSNERIKKQHPISADWLRDIADHPSEGLFAAPIKRPDAAIRILRTSGTTGGQKLLVVTASQQEARLQERMMRLCMSEDIRYLLTQPFSVNNNHGNATACLRAGGVVVSEPRFTVAQAIKTHAISYISLIPFQLMDLLKNLPEGYSKPPQLTISVYGGAISDALRAEAITRLAGKVLCSYSSNECSLISEVTSEGMGMILPGVCVEVVDATDTPLPLGCSGAIRVRTKTMADRYLDSPEAAKGMFRDGWFYPGDTGILHDRNILQFVSRTDDLLNIGGVKMAPNILEEMVLKNTRVKDVGVCTIPAADGVERLCVAVSTDGVFDNDLAEQIIRCFDNQLGTVYVIRLKSIPRTGNGKIQRILLKETISKMVKPK